MKSYISVRLSLGLGLGLIMLESGCLPQATIPVETSALGQTTEPSQPVDKSEADESLVAEQADAPETSDALSKVVSSEKPLPESIHPVEALASILKLFQAGVDESVLFSFITNTTSTFSLGA